MTAQRSRVHSSTNIFQKSDEPLAESLLKTDKLVLPSHFEERAPQSDLRKKNRSEVHSYASREAASDLNVTQQNASHQLRKSLQFKQSVLQKKSDKYQRLNGLFSPQSTFKGDEPETAATFADPEHERRKTLNEYYAPPSSKYKSVRQVNSQRSDRNKVKSA
jgi:hypothetical protein